MGPEGGINGGEIIAQGKPEDICKIDKSYTGKFLKNFLNSKYKIKLLNKFILSGV